MKIWVLQGGTTDSLDLTGGLEGFGDIHHWSFGSKAALEKKRDSWKNSASISGE
jgi:hypothetical protein